MPFRIVNCESPDDVIPSIWKAVPVVTKAWSIPSPPYLYRGHALAESWQLLPSSLRSWRNPANSEKPGIWFADGNSEPDPRRVLDVTRMSFAKQMTDDVCEQIASFATLAGSLGLLHGAAAAEATSFLNGHIYKEAIFDSAPALVGLAQHHGIATPYLDWTSNPLVALWFACNEIVRMRRMVPFYALEEQDAVAASRPAWELEDACVWIFPAMHFPICPRLKLYQVVDQEFARAQGGFFTYDSGASMQFVNVGTITHLDAFMNQEQVTEYGPVQVRFPHSFALTLMMMLKRNGISEAHLQPTLGTVARLVKMPSMRHI